MTTTRWERAEAAGRLRAGGLKQREIADLMGISRSYTASLLSDPDGSKEGVRKAQYGGDCVDCGKRTDGSNGRPGAPARCLRCSGIEQHENRYWQPERIIEAIQRFARLNGRPPLAPEWLLGVSEQGYPACSTIQSEFGSWAAGIEAAGFPRPERGQHERTPEMRGRISAAQRRRWGITDTYGQLTTIGSLNIGVEQSEGLRQRAEDEGTTLSEQARRAFAAYLDETGAVERPGLLRRLLRAA